MKPTTPLESYPDLAKAVGIKELYFKREDLHPFGSHKGRSIPVMIDHYYEKGDRRFVISSSGNAALAAALYAKKLDEQGKRIELTVFVGQKIKPSKFERLQKLESENIRILKKERPLQALNESAESGLRSLRQSTDDIALLGYESLAQEIIDCGEKVDAVFIGTSSGTTAQALASYFMKTKCGIAVHIVQTSSCHKLSDAFQNCNAPDEISIADAIVDQLAYRKNALVPLIKETNGKGWCANNEEIRAAMELTEKYSGLSISPNSALSVAGLTQAAFSDAISSAVCLICGE